MPNWCDNFITITGDKEKIDGIKHIIRECAVTKQGVFVSLVGLPPDVTPENYNEKWYDSHIAWWGTKWDVHYDDNGCWNLDDDDCITISVDTAWSPPEPFCQKLAQYFDVEVEIQYSESGNNYAGRSLFNKDGLTESEEYNDYMEGMYHINKEQFWSEVEYRMDCWSDDASNEEEFDIDKTLAEEFAFCTDKEREEIKKDFIENYKTEDNEQEA
jgi:hypothetical protein